MKSLLLGLAACLLGGSAHESSPHDSTAADVVEIDGVLQPFRTVEVGASSDRVLREVLVDRGDLVVAGQIVAQLDFEVEEVEARLAEARSALQAAAADTARVRLEDARRRFDRLAALIEEGIVTSEELAVVRTEVRLAELDLRSAAENLRVSQLAHERALAILARGTIKSPVTGVVTERFLSPGELLSRSGQGTVLTVAQLDPLLVELHAPYALFGHISVGDTVDVRLGMDTRRATVTTFDRVIDTASNTFRVRMQLANDGYALPAGLRCRVRFAP